MKIDKLVLGRLANNTYFIIVGDRCIVIDPSMEYDKIIGYIKDNNLTVEAILLTHAHYDHIYSLYELKRDTGAKIYLHKDDLEMYGFSVNRIRGTKTDIDVLLSGGETFNILGEEIKVIHNPGHAKGCVSYVIGDNMFAGDFIFKGSVGRTDLPTSNPEEMENSLKEFVALGGNYNIFCGHGEETTYAQELNTNPFLVGLK